MVKQLYGDTILLELQKEEWEKENRKSPIIRPDAVREREEGADKTRIPFHFFKVVQMGPECKKVSLGDRIIPLPPTPDTPPMQMIVLWKEEKREVAFIIREKSVAGVE